MSIKQTNENLEYIKYNLLNTIEDYKYYANEITKLKQEFEQEEQFYADTRNPNLSIEKEDYLTLASEIEDLLDEVENIGV